MTTETDIIAVAVVAAAIIGSAIGVLLMPLAPFLMAWISWGESDEMEDGQ